MVRRGGHIDKPGTLLIRRHSGLPDARLSARWMIIVRLMEHRLLERSVRPAVSRALGVFSVVVVVGPPQVGKSTLVREPPTRDGRLYLLLHGGDRIETPRPRIVSAPLRAVL